MKRLLFAILLISATANSATVYFSKDGNGTDGTSWTNAYTTIADMNANVSAGDTALIGQGTWSDATLSVVQGNSINDMTVYTCSSYTARPLIYGADTMTAWTLYSGDIYYRSTTESEVQFTDANGDWSKYLFQGDSLIYRQIDDGTINVSQAGEWMWDAGTNRLYVWCYGGGDPDNYAMWMSDRPAVQFPTSDGTRRNFVKLHGLIMKYGSPQAVVLIPNGEFMPDTCKIDSCVISHAAGARSLNVGGIHFGQQAGYYAQGWQISNCTLSWAWSGNDSLRGVAFELDWEDSDDYNSAAIMMHALSGSVVNNNWFIEGGDGGNIYCKTGDDSITYGHIVRNTYIYDNDFYGTSQYDASIRISSNLDSLYVIGNRFHRRDVVPQNQVAVRSGGSSITNAFSGPVYILNNTMYDNVHPLYGDDGGNIYEWVFKFNIIEQGSRVMGFRLNDNQPASRTHYLDSNQWFLNGQSATWEEQNGTSVSSLASWCSAEGYECASVEQDPQLADPANEDFTPSNAVAFDTTYTFRNWDGSGVNPWVSSWTVTQYGSEQPSSAVKPYPTSAETPSGPLTVHSNAKWFADGTGAAVALVGSHNWVSLKNFGNADPPPSFDYGDYVSKLKEYNHNFTKLWVWESDWKTAEHTGLTWRYFPPIYERSGGTNALDGKPKYDLTTINGEFLDSLQNRSSIAGDSGLYVCVQLFQGWSLGCKGTYCDENPWDGHPFNASNNISGYDGDSDADGYGHEVHEDTTIASGALWAAQKLFIDSVMARLADHDHVIYEVSNESEEPSLPWQEAVVDYVHSVNAAALIGITTPWDGSTSPSTQQDSIKTTLSNDWASCNTLGFGSNGSQTAHSGDKPWCADTDHLCGLCNDRDWVWYSFLRGQQPWFMDCWDDNYGIGCGSSDTADIRANLGYLKTVADSVDLAWASVQDALSADGFCLADTLGYTWYVAYSLDATVDVDVSNTPLPNAGDSIVVSYLNPGNGTFYWDNDRIGSGDTASYTFTPPFVNDVVVVLKRQSYASDPGDAVTTGHGQYGGTSVSATTKHRP